MAQVVGFRTIGATSAFSSTLVAATCLLFESLRKSFFTRIILMIALSDIGVSVAAVIGFPHNGQRLFSLQAVLFIFCLRANWIWTTMLVIQMYRFIMHNKVFFSERVMHVIVVGISALLTFLPLIKARFGRESVYSSGEMCFLVSSNDEWEKSWEIIIFTVTLWICILSMIWFISLIYARYRSVNDTAQQSQILGLVMSLYMYPVIMMLTWGVAVTFNNVYTFTSPSSPSTQSLVLDIVLTLAVSNGFWLSLIFFYKSPEARRRWGHILLGTELDEHTGSLDFDETSVGNDGLAISFATAQTTSEIWRGSSLDDML
jgi:hypothetical protein